MVTSAPIYAERKVFFNGELMNGDELSIFDAMNGAQIEDGYYWVNLNTWEWGTAAPSNGKMPKLEFWTYVNNCALEEAGFTNPVTSDLDSLLESYNSVIDNLYPLNVKPMINYIETNYMGSNLKPEQRLRLRHCTIKFGLGTQTRPLTSWDFSFMYSYTPDPESSSFKNPIPVLFGDIPRRDKAFYERMEIAMMKILESQLPNDQLQKVKTELDRQTTSELRLEFLTLMLEKIAG